MCGVAYLQMTVTSLASTRFAFSPLAEVGMSLYLVSGGEVQGVHQRWYQQVAPALATVDMELLCSVVPRLGRLADFLFAGVSDAGTRIETQLELLADLPAEVFESEIKDVWRGNQPGPRAQALLAMGRDGTRRAAEVMLQYWTVAVEPYWARIRAVLEDDVAFRAGGLARSGLA